MEYSRSDQETLAPDLYMKLPVDLFTDIVVTHEGKTFHIQGEGSSIFIEFPTAWIAFKELRTLKTARLCYDNYLYLLGIFDLGLEIFIANKQIIKIGSTIEPNIFARILGISSARISLTNIILSIIRFPKKKKSV